MVTEAIIDSSPQATILDHFLNRVRLLKYLITSRDSQHLWRIMLDKAPSWCYYKRCILWTQFQGWYAFQSATAGIEQSFYREYSNGSCQDMYLGFCVENLLGAFKTSISLHPASTQWHTAMVGISAIDLLSNINRNRIAVYIISRFYLCS